MMDAVGDGRGCWPAARKAVFVKEHEQQRHLDALIGELVGLALAVTL